MARLRTRGQFRGLEVVLGILAVVGVVLVAQGVASRQLATLLQGASLALVMVVLIAVVERRARSRPR